ncbi:hypothetical protein [uncultured Shewanella sp.]|uniref:hypothetical protein n=1 Tax=uncultured Shewanella sp. TaxID=173975 RepID=UPI00261537BA|nr:hypothetical protein [uncultured Shewanella sp.]
MWYHRIFDEIIEGDDDFVGMIAYAIYKQEKIKWINVQYEKTGSYPVKDEIDRYFHDVASTPDSLARYRQQAEDIVNKFTQLSLFEELDEYKKQLRDDHIIKSIEEKLYKGKAKTIFENVISGLVGSGIIVILSVFYFLFDKMQEEKMNQAPSQLPAIVEKYLPENLNESSDNYLNENNIEKLNERSY